jgi:hypothetical protein
MTMGFMTKVADFFAGGTVSTIADVVEKYFPPSMTDGEKATLQMQIQNAEHAREKDLLQLANEADAEFNQRIRDLEGTASDLKSIPIIGPVLIFARGAQRPVWGFATLFLDYQVLSKAWDIMGDPQLKAMLFAINLLVLGFLFGERAIKNVAPLLGEYFAKKAA